MLNACLQAFHHGDTETTEDAQRMNGALADETNCPTRNCYPRVECLFPGRDRLSHERRLSPETEAEAHSDISPNYSFRDNRLLAILS
jgi:hypothetical protein